MKLALKDKLLKEHTLDAVFSMPDELFHNSNATVNTCIMVFKAKEKHPTNYKTYFGYWKNDGFIKIKNIGRTDFYHTWHGIKKGWIKNYRNKEEVAGHSIKKVVTPNNEWCAEAYMETKYSNLKKEYFMKNIKAYLAFKLLKENSYFAIKTESFTSKSIVSLSTDNWKYFRYDDGTENSMFEIKKGKRLTKKDQSDGAI